jgi:Domain of unknown function (DUF222)/HNH endonuclease
MSSTALLSSAATRPGERLEALFDELAELTGQRNAIDGRIVEIVAEIDRDQLCGMTGARSVPALVAWKTGCSPATANTIATVAHRLAEFPRCARGLREGRLSLDQVGVIAARAGEGSDEHYAQLARHATVTQLRTAIKLEPRPDPQPCPQVERSFTRTRAEQGSCYRITLGHLDAAAFDAALASHREALIAEWKRDHGSGESGSEAAPPLPGLAEAFLSLVEAGWDAEATRRPHGQHTTVVVHVDAAQRTAALHLGPLLSDADRRYLTCDATAEVWVKRHGRPIGAGRMTRLISRRLRRALEHRDRTCAVPGCGATRGLHAHHLRHWEDGGPTELTNLVLVCPYHHRLAPPGPHHHHRTANRPHRHRQLRATAARRIARACTQQSPTRRPAVPRAHRRARRLVVVGTLPAPATTNQQLCWLAQNGLRIDDFADALRSLSGPVARPRRPAQPAVIGIPVTAPRSGSGNTMTLSMFRRRPGI